MVTIALIVFCTAATIQILFLVYSYVKLSYTKVPKLSNEELPISVIVAAHNEENNLPTLLKHLLDLDYQNYEVIIALDRCTDKSNQIVNSFAQNNQLVTAIEIPAIPGNISPKKFALSKAIEAAKNEILVFTDADCVPGSNKWLSSICSSFRNDTTKISIGFSPYFKKPGFLNQFIQFETAKTALQYLIFTLSGRPYMAVGRNLAYKKSFFKEVKGFKNSQHITGGDDDLLVNRYGRGSNAHIHVGKDSVTYSYPKVDFKAYFKQKLRHLSVGKFYKPFDKFTLSLLGVSEIMFWVTFIILAAVETNLSIILGVVISRWILLMLSFSKLSNLIGNQFNVATVPLLDMVFSIYLLVMAPAGFFTRKVRWT